MARRIVNSNLSDVSSDEELDIDNMNVIDEVNDNPNENESHPNRGREAERRKDENRKRKRSSSSRSKLNNNHKRLIYDRNSASHRGNRRPDTRPKHHQKHKINGKHASRKRFELSPYDANSDHEKVRNAVLNLVLTGEFLELPLQEVIQAVCPEVLTEYKLETILKEDKHSRFDVKGELVSLKTNLRVCMKHNNGGADNIDCNDLHICKFYLVDRCDLPICAFNHELDTPHNRRVLEMHGLSSLSNGNIRRLASNVRSRNRTTLPFICKFYQNYNGCRQGNTCTCLHICTHFVQNNCTKHFECERSHDLHRLLDTELLNKYGLNTRNCDPLDLKATLYRSAMEPDIKADVQARYSSPTSSSNNLRYYQHMKKGQINRNAGGAHSAQNFERYSQDRSKAIANALRPEEKPVLRQIKTEKVMVAQNETVSTHPTDRDTNHPVGTIKQEVLSDLEEGELRCDDHVLKINKVAAIPKEVIGTSHERMPARSPLVDTNPTENPTLSDRHSCLPEEPSCQLAEKTENSTESSNSSQTIDMMYDKEANGDIITWLHDTLAEMDKNATADIKHKGDESGQEKLQNTTDSNDEMDETSNQMEDTRSESNNEHKLPTANATLVNSLDDKHNIDNPQEHRMSDVQSDDKLPESIITCDAVDETGEESKLLEAKTTHASSLDDKDDNGSSQELYMRAVKTDDKLPKSITTYATFEDTDEKAKLNQNKMRKDELPVPNGSNTNETTNGDATGDLDGKQKVPEHNKTTLNVTLDSTTMTTDKDDHCIKETLPLAPSVSKVSSLRLPPWTSISKSRDFIPLKVTSPVVDETNPIEATINFVTDGNVDDSRTVVVENDGDTDGNSEISSSMIKVTDDCQQYELQRSGTIWRRRTKDGWVDLGHAEVVVTEAFIQTISHSN